MKINLKAAILSGTVILAAISAQADNRTFKQEKGSTEAINNEQEASKFAPSNTGKNVRDRNEGRLTADNQGMSQTDTELTAKIRASLMKDDSLSTLAQNVKIIALNGVVTLRGPVRSSDERVSIANKAVQFAGVSNVKNELEVEPKN